MPIRVVRDEQGKILYTIYKIRIVKFLDSRNKVPRSDYLTSSFINQTVSSLTNAGLVDQYVVHDIAKSYSSLELAVRSISNEKGVCKYTANGRPYLTFSSGYNYMTTTREVFSNGRFINSASSDNPDFIFKYHLFGGLSDPNKFWLDQYGAIAIQFIFRDHSMGSQIRMISSKGFTSSKEKINLFEFFRKVCLEPGRAVDSAKRLGMYSYDVTLIDGISASYKYYINKTYCPQA